MKRLIENTVFLGLVTAWRLATWPTRRSPSLVNPTTEGVVRLPSELGITTGSPPSITAKQELVVPRSIPITLLMLNSSTDYELHSANIRNCRLKNFTNVKEQFLCPLFPAIMALILPIWLQQDSFDSDLLG